MSLTEADLEQRNVDSLLKEDVGREQEQEAEEARDGTDGGVAVDAAGVARGLETRVDVPKRAEVDFAGGRSAVYADALGNVDEVRGREQPSLEAGRDRGVWLRGGMPEDRLGHRAGRALAFRAGDVDYGELVGVPVSKTAKFSPE